MIHFTLIWNTFVFCQVFNLICCRDVTNRGMNGFSGLHRNFMTYLIILVIFAVQFLSCFTFLGRMFFEAGHTGGREFLVTIVAACSVLVANCLLKLVPDSLLAKVPQMDEDTPIGGNSKILSAYNAQSKAKAFQPKGDAAVVVSEVDNENSL